MSVLKIPISNKRLCCTVFVTASLFLVFLGMRVPNLSKLHSPKPRPRAIIETTIKASQTAGIRVNADVIACPLALVLNFPTPFISSSRQEIRKVDFISIEHQSARAPPVISV